MVEISNPAIVPGTSVGRFGADPLLDGHHRVTTWGVGACLSVSGAVVASREPSPGTSATFSGDSVGMQGERDVTWRALAGRRSPAPSSCSRAMRSSPTNSTARRRVGSRGGTSARQAPLIGSGPDLALLPHLRGKPLATKRRPEPGAPPSDSERGRRGSFTPIVTAGRGVNKDAVAAPSPQSTRSRYRKASRPCKSNVPGRRPTATP